MVSQEILDYLKLPSGVIVALKSDLSKGRQLKQALQADTSNLFGKPEAERTFLANATFKKHIQDEVKGRPGIYLTPLQMRQLFIYPCLKPLCGADRLEKAKNKAPQVKGVIQLFHQGKSIEVDVYPLEKNTLKFADSSVTITQSLYEVLGCPQMGDPLQLCSRFDVTSLEEAEEKAKEFPILETKELDAIKTLKTIKQIWEWKRLDEAKLVINDLLEAMTRQVQQLVENRDLLSFAFKVFEDFELDSLEPCEYLRFIQALKKVEFTQKQQEKYVTGCWYTQPLTRAFIKAGIHLKNFRDENFLHIFIDRLTSLHELGSCVATLIKEKDKEGYTPLHLFLSNWINFRERYISRATSWKNFAKELISFTEPLKACKPTDFIGKCGTPFHFVLNDLNERGVPAALTLLKVLMKQLGPETLLWFEEKDTVEKKPFDYVLDKGPEVYKRFLGLLKKHPTEKNTQIFNKLNEVYRNKKDSKVGPQPNVLSDEKKQTFDYVLDKGANVYHFFLRLLKSHPSEENTQILSQDEVYSNAFQEFTQMHVIDMPPSYAFPPELRPVMFRNSNENDKEREAKLIKAIQSKDVCIAFRKWAEENEKFLACDSWIRKIDRVIAEKEKWKPLAPEKSSSRYFTYGSYYKRGIITLAEAMNYLSKQPRITEASLLRKLPLEKLCEILTTENDKESNTLDSASYEDIALFLEKIDSETLLKICFLEIRPGVKFVESIAFLYSKPGLQRFERAHLLEFLAQQRSAGGNYLHNYNVLDELAPRLCELTAKELFPLLSSQTNDGSFLLNEAKPHLLIPALLRLPLEWIAALLMNVHYYKLENYWPVLEHLSQRLDLLLSVIVSKKMNPLPSKLRSLVKKFKGDNLAQFLAAETDLFNNERFNSNMHNEDLVCFLLPQILELSRPIRKSLMLQKDCWGRTPLHRPSNDNSYLEVCHDFDREDLKELFSQFDNSGKVPFDCYIGAELLIETARVTSPETINPLIHMRNEDGSYPLYQSGKIEKLVPWLKSLKSEDLQQICNSQNEEGKTLLDYPRINKLLYPLLESD